MSDIRMALERKEKIAIMYRGKQMGVIVPCSTAKDTSVSKHPFFGMLPQDTNVQNRKTCWYKLEDVGLNGQSTLHGSVSATPRLIYGQSK